LIDLLRSSDLLGLLDLFVNFPLSIHHYGGDERAPRDRFSLRKRETGTQSAALLWAGGAGPERRADGVD
jgi:hypothetical protein